MSRAQEKMTDLADQKTKSYVGVSLGALAHRALPFTKNDYEYTGVFIKAHYRHRIKSYQAFDVYIEIAPSFYRVNHKLNNFFFITPQEENFQMRRAFFQMPRIFNEYALQLGFSIEKHLTGRWSLTFTGTSGPMYGEQETERLAKGFAFSNILGLGSIVKITSELSWQFKILARHTSNAGFKRPNSGHNSLGFASGVLWRL